MKRKCCNCLWGDNCPFEMPCDYYTPLDYEARLDTKDFERRRREFIEDWFELMENYENNIY